MYRYALRKVHVREDAEDIVAEVFIKFYKIQETVKDARHWLFTATKNKAIDFIRSRKTNIDLDDVEVSDEVVESPMDYIIVELFSEIEKLTPARRKVLELSVVGLTPWDIALKLGISYQSARNEKARAFNDIRNQFFNKKHHSFQ